MSNADLITLFASCKLHFRYKSDVEVFKQSEHWIDPSEIKAAIDSLGIVLGDCDDFASLCVFVGRRANKPMRFVICLTETDELHCVAECGGWILDNRQDEVMRRDDLPYKWIAISGFNRGEPWHSIKG